MTTLLRPIVGDRRSTVATTLMLMLLVVPAAACSGRGAVAQEDPNAPVLLGVDGSYITVENRAGMALSDVRVVVLAYNGLEFTTRFPRIENSQRREISFGELSGRDGTQFNPRFYRPKSVRLHASDVRGKEYEIETAWQ